MNSRSSTITNMSSMSGQLSRSLSSSDLFRGVVWSTALAVSVAGIVIGGVVLLRHVPPLATALLSGAPDPTRPNGLNEVVERHDESAAVAKGRFDKRSFFFDPPAPRPKPQPAPPPPPPPPPIDTTPPPPPPPPAKYGGPKPYSIFGDMVFFSNKGVIKLGEERDGVKVLAINAPWTVKLGWERGEYEESIWESIDKHLTNALADGETGSKGLFAADKANEALDGIAGVAGSTPSAPSASARTVLKPQTPSGRGKAGESAEEAARAHEDGGEEQKHDEAASGSTGGEGEGETEQPAERRVPYTKEQIEGFDRMAAAKALQEASKAKNDPKLDDATKKIYQEEYDLIVAHLKNMNAQGGSKK